MKHRLGKLLRHTRGATAIEYGLIVSLVVLGMLAGFIMLAGTTTGIWSDIVAKVTAAG